MPPGVKHSGNGAAAQRVSRSLFGMPYAHMQKEDGKTVATQEPDDEAIREDLAKNAAEVVEDLDRMAESDVFPERLRDSAGRNADAFVATVAQGIDNARRFDQMESLLTDAQVLLDGEDIPALASMLIGRLTPGQLADLAQRLLIAGPDQRARKPRSP
jgi:hypothetical protein